MGTLAGNIVHDGRVLRVRCCFQQTIITQSQLEANFGGFSLISPHTDGLTSDSVPKVETGWDSDHPLLTLRAAGIGNVRRAFRALFPRQAPQCMLESKVTNSVFGYKNIGGRILQVVVAFGGLADDSPVWQKEVARGYIHPSFRDAIISESTFITKREG